MRDLILLFATCFGLAGCGSDPTELPTTDDYSFDQIDLFGSVAGNGGAALVDVSLQGTRSDGTSLITLAEGDLLFVSAEDAPEIELSPHSGYRYAALLPTQGLSPVVSFRRAGVTGANAKLTLPTPFALVVPGGPVSVSAPWTITWDPQGWANTITLDVYGPCISLFSRDLASDTGTYTLQPGDLVFDGTSCTLTVALTKTQTNAVTAPFGFHSAGFMALQTRSATVEVTP